MKMIIAGEPFIEIEMDFLGKSSIQARQEHLEDIAAVLHSEYQQEIIDGGGQVEFYYEIRSLANDVYITAFEEKEFEIQLRAKRFRKTVK